MISALLAIAAVGPAAAAQTARFTLDGQIETGGAWVGTLAEVKAIIARVVKSIGKLERASLRINFGTIDVGEAQKSMRLFATRLALNY